MRSFLQDLKDRNVWIPIGQLSALGVSRRAVMTAEKNGRWWWRELPECGRGRNGKPIREVHLSSLTPEQQAKWLIAARDALIRECERITGSTRSSDPFQ